MLTWETLNTLLLTILPRMEWLLIAIVLDVILGIAVALKEHIFQWELVAGFLETYGLKILGWLVLEILTIFPKELTGGIILEGAAWVAYIAIVTTALASILGHIQMFGNILKFAAPALEKFGLPRTYTVEEEEEIKMVLAEEKASIEDKEPHAV